MSEDGNDIFKRMAELYFRGDVPWDSTEPPPEVIEFLEGAKPGTAIDLGCGYGRAAIYMAKLGWEVDAIDFIPEALAEASRRASLEGVDIRFHQSEVTDLDYLSGQYDYGLDVGCSHNLSEGELEVYRDHLKRLIKPGGLFMLFARVQGEDAKQEGEGPAAHDIGVFKKLFEDGFTIEGLEEGFTDVGEHGAWNSVWFSFRRLSVNTHE